MIFKAVGIAVIALCASLFIRGSMPVFVHLTVFGAGMIILMMFFDEIREEIVYLYNLCCDNKYGNYFKLLLKGVGVAYIASIASDLCRDCGELQLADRVELAAKAEILIIAFPLIRMLIEFSEGILTV